MTPSKNINVEKKKNEQRVKKKKQEVFLKPGDCELRKGNKNGNDVKS